MKLYDRVKRLLEQEPKNRDSDKRLIWRVWQLEGRAIDRTITWDSFKLATSTESIRRCRQKIQELHPYLRCTEETEKRRKEIEKERGTFIFRAIV